MSTMSETLSATASTIADVSLPFLTLWKGTVVRFKTAEARRAFLLETPEAETFYR